MGNKKRTNESLKEAKQKNRIKKYGNVNMYAPNSWAHFTKLYHDASLFTSDAWTTRKNIKFHMEKA